MDELNSLPGCFGYFNTNECEDCRLKTLCIKVFNDEIFNQLIKIEADLKRILQQLSEVEAEIEKTHRKLGVRAK